MVSLYCNYVSNSLRSSKSGENWVSIAMRDIDFEELSDYVAIPLTILDILLSMSNPFYITTKRMRDFSLDFNLNICLYY